MTMATSITITAAKPGLDSRLFFPSILQIAPEDTLLSGAGPGEWDTGFIIFEFNGEQYKLTYKGSVEFNAYKDFHGIVTTGTLGRLVDEDEQIYKTLGTISFLPDRSSSYDGGILDTVTHLTPNALNLMNSYWNGAFLNFLGNDGDDRLDGSDFDDFFDGGKGNDKLTGNGGSDQFLFGALGKANADHVADFDIHKDTLLIDRSEGLFKGVSTGNLSRTFHDITSQAEQGDDRILYNHKTGALSYDSDGSGHAAAVIFGYIDNHAALKWNDFAIG
jgi:hypothetical protein